MFYCKLIDADISGDDCVVISDVCEDMLVEDVIDEKFRIKPDYKKICRNCNYHVPMWKWE